MMAEMPMVAALMIKTNVTIMILHANACDNYDRHHWQKAGLIPGVALSLCLYRRHSTHCVLSCSIL